MTQAGTGHRATDGTPRRDRSDAASDPACDRITELLAGICEAPIAAIGRIDGERHWIESACGADRAVLALPAALAAHTLAQREPLVVDDTERDPRFATDALVCAAPGWRFYAGIALVDGNGTALGTLFVLDRLPRRLTSTQRLALTTLADQVVMQIEAAQRPRRLEGDGNGDERWRMLFERNPMPMWLYDLQTLRILAVNDAAVAHYGWSVREFTAMTILDIRPAEELPALMDDLAGIHHDLRGPVAWRHRKKNGELIDVDITAHSLPFEGHDARLVMVQDITERVRAAEAVRAGEARWERLFAASATGIAAAGLDGRFVGVNPAFCRLVGRSEAELLGAPMLGFTHAEDVRVCQREMDRLAAGEVESVCIDKRYVRPDGTARWARASVVLTAPTAPTSAGSRAQPRQYVAVVQDIDAQRHAQEDLRRQHGLVALAGQLARLGGWEVVVEPVPTVRWTDELRTILEIPSGDVPSVAEGIDLYHPGSRERIADAVNACLGEGKPFDLELDTATANGRTLHVRVIGQAWRDAAGRIVGAQGALIDQTDLQRAQQALRDSEERFRTVARATADAVWDWDLTDGSVWWSEGIHTLFGYDTAALERRFDAWLARIHPDDREAVHAGMHAAIVGGAGEAGDRWNAEFRFARADDSYAVVLNRGFVIRDDIGRGRRMVGGMTDLSAQRASEQRMRRQAALLDAARDAIVVRDLEHRILYWNRGAENLFGWRQDEVLGRSVSELRQENVDAMEQALGEVLRRGEWAGVVKSSCRDGRTVMIDLRLSLLRDPAGRPEAVLAIETDVTQRVALEAQLDQAQRLEAVGQLTGGVAHDFNNLLTVILGNAELLSEMLVDQPALLPLAQMTAQAAERGAELTQRLLAFARKQPLQPQAVDAHLLLSGMDALLRRTLPEDIELQLVRAAGLWPLLADPVQLESAVLNLVLNARDAMPDGGKITLETANAWIDQDYAERHVDVLPGQYTMLSVSDTGAGMSAQTLARAFEPFFTTKGVGKGTGLGLSMVYGFAKQSRGHVKLYSEVGHGTTVRLYLPRAEQADSVVPQALVPPGGELRGAATVLVVEDDDLVRRFAVDMLRSLGYAVLSAEQGVAALEVLRARSDIDLLFTDVVMPGGINGRQLADMARALHPSLKVLFTSGYTENAIVHHGRLDRGVHLLTKPYRAVDLARKVRVVLG